MNVIESFMKVREDAQKKFEHQSSTTFKGNNVLPLCGKSRQGVTYGVYLADGNGVPYRIIEGYRKFRINKETAEAFGIKEFELAICDSNQYPEKVRGKITTLNKMLETVEKFWEGTWETAGIAKYQPRWVRRLTIQYMKVLRGAELNGTLRKIEQGVKVITSHSDAYYKAFDGFIESKRFSAGSLDFLTDLMGRQSKRFAYTVRVELQESKGYNITISENYLNGSTIDVSEEDLKLASDLNSEVADLGISEEILDKWIEMLTSTFKRIKEDVIPNAVEQPKPVVQAEPAKVEPVKVEPAKVEPAKVEPVATAQVDDLFG